MLDAGVDPGVDQRPRPSALDDYRFDLNGFLVVKGALSAAGGFLDRLTSPQRHIMEPVPPVLPGDARIPQEARHYSG